MPPGYNVREATAADSNAIARHRYFDLSPEHAALSVYAAWVEHALARGTYRGLLAEHDGRVVAGAGLTRLDWGPTKDDPSSWRARIVNVYTEPAARRRGLARDLVTRLLVEARSAGVRTVTLGSTDAARALYASLGFRAVEREMTLRFEE